jgi:hypothetical protein
LHLASCLLLALLASSCALADQPSPRILSVQSQGLEVGRYGKFELAVALEATYDNPYDVRQVDLTAVFIGPDGREWAVPGFWDGDEAWRVRFTPSAEGGWRYSVQVRDRHGESRPYDGRFTCLPSGDHGWLQVGDWVDPAYSARYLAYHDGTPFYGAGHCNAFDLMSYGLDAEGGFVLLDTMAEHGENMLVYWPIYSNPFFATRYDRYSLPDLRVIDLVVEDAARSGIHLVFTIWNHDLLRDGTHAWGDGVWETRNGFRELGSLDSFFTAAEAWAWQENLYRYVIARWGYSPAIGLWQTVSEIEGTNAGSHADSWHERVNRFFVEHDPYRHPTTASKAGDAWWPAGYAVMDVAQMHSYDSQHDPVGTGPLIAGWTQKLWQAEAKPNFIGEFGTSDERLHPDLLHNGIWAGLAAGAAATPMEWNDPGNWGRMDGEMLEHMAHLASFVADLPLARLDPTPLQVTTGDEELEAWGLVGGGLELALSGVEGPVPSEAEGTGFFWVQDTAPGETRAGDTITVEGLSPGSYTVRPFDTWQGVYLDASRATADESGQLLVVLPPFSCDIAVRLER